MCVPVQLKTHPDQVSPMANSHAKFAPPHLSPNGLTGTGVCPTVDCHCVLGVAGWMDSRPHHDPVQDRQLQVEWTSPRKGPASKQSLCCFNMTLNAIGLS